uniref:Reverse transcriptase domain-containing protein n=1 Tax=Tanacetum cinerariifolium TaxID=118510 RepID=A0A6L2KND8_TANCI|nr:hypothetical protein [Tanacetum cinerariifolium]
MHVIVDDTHICIRIREIQVECDEVFLTDSLDSKSTKDASSNHDDGANNVATDENDELYDDESDSNNMFLGERDWIHDEGENEIIDCNVLSLEEVVLDTQFKEKSHHSQIVSARITTDAVDPFLVCKVVDTREHRLINLVSSSSFTESENETLNTIEVGTYIGYDMVGRERDVNDIIDFEKAFDSLDWKFLDHTMEQMVFSQKLRSWIRGCLNSAYASVLVNGSPTQEFKIQKGLRQGDPPSPFLFILAIEALHVSLQEAKSKNLFEGVKCTYLGLPIGANLNKSNSWKPIIDKFHKTLSIWKAKNLSYGDRLTLTKSVHEALGI